MINDLTCFSAIGGNVVVMAYWPGTGSSLENIDYTKYHVGIIQYFLRHAVTFHLIKTANNTSFVSFTGNNLIIPMIGLGTQQ